MKALVFIGSPRPAGDTACLADTFLRRLGAQARVVRAYAGDIAPCVDCRACMTRRGCVRQDAMQQVYADLEDCDLVALASPIYFSELTGPLLSVLSRLQALYCARVFQGRPLIQKEKVGALILVGGGDGEMDRAAATGKTLLRQMMATKILPPVCSHQSNRIPAGQDAAALEAVRALADQCVRAAKEMTVR